MELIEAIKKRRSVRKFTKQQISKDKIKKIIDAARWAPSACNRQLWEFVIVTREDLKKDIADGACFKQKFLKEAPVLIVVFYDDTKERREEKGPAKHDSIQSAAAAIQNMLLSAWSLGLGTLWVCSIRKMLKLNDILKVPRNIRPIAIVALGYPAETPHPPKRRTMEAFVHHEQFRGREESYPNSANPKDWSLKELADFREKICWYGGRINSEINLEKFNMKSRTYRYIISIVEKFLKPKEKLLDILPFAGGYLIGLLKIVSDSKRVICLESGDGNVRFIRENLKKFHLSEPDFIMNKNLKLEKKLIKADLITCFYRLEKVPAPDYLFNEMAGMLKKGGKIVLVNELKGFTGFGKWIMSKRNLHVTHLWNTGPSVKLKRKVINKLIDRSNCRIVKQEIFHENRFIKSFAKQILRSDGPSLITVIEKI